MEKKIWHCFSVSDYKGGELHSEVNLSTNELLDTISNDGYLVIENYEDEFWHSLELGDPKLKEFLVKLFKEAIEQDFDSNGTYAGYSGNTTPEIYLTSPDGHLEEAFPTDEEIGNYMFGVLETIVENG